VDLVFPLLEGGETGRIDSKDLTDWVVRQFLFLLLMFFFFFWLSCESLRRPCMLLNVCDCAGEGL
jgi:hypothetical protein